MTTKAPKNPVHEAKATKLGRYETALGEERVLLGRREDGEVSIYDAPTGEAVERTFFVERGFESKAELAMLVRDYLRQAELLGSCPMGPRAIRVIAASSKEALS